VRKTTFLASILAFSKWIVDARFVSKIMRKSALVSLWTIIFIVEFATHVLWWLWLDNISLDRMRKKAVEAVLAITHIKVNAG
jgi:hypothetical protein